MTVLSPGQNYLQNAELQSIQTAAGADLNNPALRARIHYILNAANTAELNTAGAPAHTLLAAGHSLYAYQAHTDAVGLDTRKAFDIIYAIPSVRRAIDSKIVGMSGVQLEAAMRKMQNEIYSALQQTIGDTRVALTNRATNLRNKERELGTVTNKLRTLITTVNGYYQGYVPGPPPPPPPAIPPPSHPHLIATVPPVTDFHLVETQYQAMVADLRRIPPPGGMDAAVWLNIINSFNNDWSTALANHDHLSTEVDSMQRTMIPAGVVAGAPLADLDYHAQTLLDNLSTQLGHVEAIEQSDFQRTAFEIQRDNSVVPPFSITLMGVPVNPTILTDYIDWALANQKPGSPEQNKLISAYLASIAATDRVWGIPAPLTVELGLGRPDPTRVEFLTGNPNIAVANGITQRLIQDMVATYTGNDLDTDIETWIGDLLSGTRPVTGATAAPFNAAMAIFAGADGVRLKRFLAIHLADQDPSLNYNRDCSEAQLDRFLTEQITKAIKPNVSAYKLEQVTGSDRWRVNSGPDMVPDNIDDYRAMMYYSHLIDKFEKDENSLTAQERDYLEQAGSDMADRLIQAAGPQNWIHHARTAVTDDYTALNINKRRNANAIADALCNSAMALVPAVPMRGYTPPGGAPAGLTPNFERATLGLTAVGQAHLNLFRWHYANQKKLKLNPKNKNAEMRRFIMRSILENEGINGTAEAAEQSLQGAIDDYARVRGRYARHRFLQFDRLRGLHNASDTVLDWFTPFLDTNRDQVEEARQNYQDTLNYKVVTALSEDYLEPDGAHASLDIVNDEPSRLQFMADVVDQVLDARGGLITSERRQYTPTLTQRWQAFHQENQGALALSVLATTGVAALTAVLSTTAAPVVGGVAALWAGMNAWSKFSYWAEAGIGKFYLWGRHRTDTETVGEVSGHRRTRNNVEGLANDLAVLNSAHTGTPLPAGINAHARGPISRLASQIATHSNERLYSQNRYRRGRAYADNLQQLDRDVFLHDLLEQFNGVTGISKEQFMYDVVNYAIEARENLMNQTIEDRKSRLRIIRAGGDVLALGATFGAGALFNHITDNWFFGGSEASDAAGAATDGGTGVGTGTEGPSPRVETGGSSGGIESTASNTPVDQGTAQVKTQTGQIIQNVVEAGTYDINNFSFEVPHGAVLGDQTPGPWKLIKAALDLNDAQVSELASQGVIQELMQANGKGMSSYIYDGEMLNLRPETIYKIADIAGQGTTPNDVMAALSDLAK